MSAGAPRRLRTPSTNRRSTPCRRFCSTSGSRPAASHEEEPMTPTTVVLDNDFVGGERPGPYDTWTLAETALAASAYWDAVGLNLDNAIIRDFGLEPFSDFIRDLFTSHQRQFFLPGLEKLRIDPQLPPAVRAARYHLLSNAVAGIRTRNVDESPEKAWILYLPATGQIGEPAYIEEHWISIFRGWHARNGLSLGRPGLVFVATHLTSRGDPFTGGYFLDTGDQNVAPGERFTEGFGESAPPLDRWLHPEVDEAEWPLERRLKALRNFSVHWAWDRLATALSLRGADVTPAISRSVAAATYAHLPILQALAPGD